MHAVFLMIQYLGIVILMLEAFYIAGQKSSRQQQTLLMLVVALCINFMGFLLELDASTMQEALIAVKFSYLGKPYIALCQFLFVMQVCKIQIPRRVVTVLAGLNLPGTDIFRIWKQGMASFTISTVSG